MEWLTQNWAWIIFAVGAVMLIRRGGMSCGMGHDRSEAGNGSGPGSDRSTKDPINGEIVNPESAFNSMYLGHIYYFSSRENRDTFEASSTTYATSVAGTNGEHRHHHHGC